MHLKHLLLFTGNLLPVFGAATKSSASAKAPEPQQPGIVSNCKSYYLVQKGETCSSVAAKNKLSFANFYKWNPAVGKHCQGLKKGYYVCVGVEKAVTPTPTTPENVTGNKAPSPVQKGITTSCNEYHRVSKGDTCSAVASEFKIDLNEFYKWNPAVGSKCENLWANYYYCVSVAGEKAKASVHTPSPN
ncbi:hypothetical protein LB503_007868 [Fusarium chuoi]|nr:hypothetical protein LB503_007868 [Fusarium chuoi]